MKKEEAGDEYQAILCGISFKLMTGNDAKGCGLN